MEHESTSGYDKERQISVLDTS